MSLKTFPELQTGPVEVGWDNFYSKVRRAPSESVPPLCSPSNPRKLPWAHTSLHTDIQRLAAGPLVPRSSFMLFVSCYLCWRRKSVSLFSIAVLSARCVYCALRGYNVCVQVVYLVCGLLAHWFCHVVNIHILTFESQPRTQWSTCFSKTSANPTSCRILLKLNFCFPLCCYNLCDQQDSWRKTSHWVSVAHGLWISIFSDFSFFFSAVSSREKNDRRKKPAESVWAWFSFVLTLRYRAPSLVSLTPHTTGGRRGRWRRENKT